MNKFLLVVLLVVVVLTAAALGALVWWTQDANRFKPAIEALIERETDRAVTIHGDLDWQLWPPISVVARGIESTSSKQIAIDVLTLSFNPFSLFQSPTGWTVRSLAATDLVIIDADYTLDAEYFEIEDFSLGEPAPIHVDMVLTRPDSIHLAVLMTGFVTVSPERDVWHLTTTELVVNGQSGTCDLTLGESSTTPPAQTTNDGLLPVHDLLERTVNGHCQAPSVHAGSANFGQTRIDLDNADGQLAMTARVRGFFGGTASVTANISLTDAPVTWQIEPDLQNVDSQQLLAWLEQNLDWAAPIAVSGGVSLRGNTREALLDSANGEMFFDGAKGTINIAKIKQPLLDLALVVGGGDTIAQWPDTWQYQRFTGNWDADGAEHRFGFAIDNLSLKGSGTHDWRKDKLDIQATIIVGDDPTFSSFDINPLLVDLPVPIRCRGSLQDPTCRLDEAGARNLAAQILRGDTTEPIREKLEEKIDDAVPEEYRDAARALLDALGRALEKD